MLYEPITAFAAERHAHILHEVAAKGVSRLPGLAERNAGGTMLARYLAGWAEADPTKIAAATTDGFRFDDPLVGTFAQQSLSRYFELLQGRFARIGATRTSDFAFTIRGPMETFGCQTCTLYWREARGVGLTGTTQILATNEGIVAEAVTYDLNLASDFLRQGELFRENCDAFPQFAAAA